MNLADRDGDCCTTNDCIFLELWFHFFQRSKGYVQRPKREILPATGSLDILGMLTDASTWLTRIFLLSEWGPWYLGLVALRGVSTVQALRSATTQ